MRKKERSVKAFNNIFNDNQSVHNVSEGKLVLSHVNLCL